MAPQHNWLFRGAQSAGFYFLSCTPYNKWASKRRTERLNKRARAERDREVLEGEPGMYRQPLPYEMNPGWQEEIDIGPGLPPKRTLSLPRNAKARSLSHSRSRSASRRRHGVGGDTLTPTASNTTPPGGQDTLAPIPSTNGAPSHTSGRTPAASISDGRPPSSQVESRGRSLSRVLRNARSREHDLWFDENGKIITSGPYRSQRPEEPLWGIDDVEALASNASNASRRSRTDVLWASPRNIAVNELHPAVVSALPASREGAMWMLQPPPPVAIMSGQVRETSRSISRPSSVSLHKKASMTAARGRGESGASAASSSRPRPSSSSTSSTRGPPPSAYKRRRQPALSTIESSEDNIPRIKLGSAAVAPMEPAVLAS